MNDLKLGKLIDPNAMPQRDAIHVAVCPIMATTKIWPGQHVGLDEHGGARLEPPFVGIVDPFLNEPAFAGHWFWLFLYPGTVTSLRHEWKHPAFPVQATAGESEKWLTDFAKKARLDYDAMLDIVKGYAESGDPWVEQGSEYARSAFWELGGEDGETFWRHFQSVTGVAKPRAPSWSEPFSCSC